MIDFTILLFDQFETLDAFGPAEIIGRIPEWYQLRYCSINGGIVTSTQHLQVNTEPISATALQGILLIPGGMGTRSLIKDPIFILAVKELCERSKYVLTVCTGSALLAATGLLDDRSATSNKRAFSWVQSVNERVNWVKQARWVVDDRFYTASGVSAGMDMTLGYLKDIHGRQVAREVSDSIEYIWNDDRYLDPFSIESNR